MDREVGTFACVVMNVLHSLAAMEDILTIQYGTDWPCVCLICFKVLHFSGRPSRCTCLIHSFSFDHPSTIRKRWYLDDHLVLRRLLLGLTEDVDVPARLVSSVRGVVASAVLAKSTDLLNLLGQELNLLEVVADTRWGHRLGDDAVATGLRPGETGPLSVNASRLKRRKSIVHDVSTSDLGAGALGDGLGDLLDLRAGDQERDAEHVVTESLPTLECIMGSDHKFGPYRVGSDVDVLLLAVLDQVVALQDGVALDLVSSGHDASAVDEGLELSAVSKVLNSCNADSRTCSIVWLETPTERTLLLGSWVMAAMAGY